MLANREGTFHAYPIDVGAGEIGPNHLAAVTIVFRLSEERSGAEWTDCSAEGMQITGWFFLEKKDGSLNDKTIESLKAALGWDGRDPFWLQDNAAELAQHPVQVKLAFEEFNGATNLKVQYLNPYGATGGGASKADDNTRKTIQRRIGSKLRALAGGTPANPPKPAGKPASSASKAPSAAPKSAAPKPAAPPAAAPAPAAPVTATMELAWAEFVKHCPPDKWDQEATEQEWFRVLADLFPGKQPDELSPADWGVVLVEGPSHIIPF